MTQIFHPATNTFARVSIFGAVFFLALIAWVIWIYYRSPYITEVHVAREQPVPFSHEHHVGGLGIDCRYCHTTVENSAFAGIPATQICIGCHSQIWKDAPILEPVRASYRDNKPLRWTRVHELADFAYFNHSIHVNKGVGCSTCHGRVDRMPLMWKENTLHMQWCLDCHRHPEEYIRDQKDIFSMEWTPPAGQKAKGAELVSSYHIDNSNITNCTTCHR